jgi:putative flippase GtrA
MSGLLAVVVGILVALGWLGWKVILPTLQDEAKGSVGAASRVMIKRAAERLEEPERSRWHEEWYRHLEDLGDRRLYAIWWASGILRSTPRPRKQATAASSVSSWWVLLKFGLVGGSGYVVNIAVFAILTGSVGTYPVVAAIGAFCVALSNNFFWNRHWTYGPSDGHAGFQAARFFAVSVGALLINLAVLELLLSGILMGDLAAQSIAVAVAMPFNFLGNKLWTLA